MVYMCIVKHNFILGGMCYYTKAQLHVSANKFGYLQVVHENLSISYTNMSGEFIGCGRGRCEISFVSGKGGGGRHGLFSVYKVKQCRYRPGVVQRVPGS
jgi:hypothetical protein